MKRVLCIGQAPPKTNPQLPFGRTKLYSWFNEIGISNFELVDIRSIWDGTYKVNFKDSYIFIGFSAIVNFFPGSKNGSHIPPSNKQILECQKYLKDYVNSFKPDILVPIGKQSIQYCLSDFNISLEDTIGKHFSKNPYNLYNKKIDIVPLPHPSGASTWIYLNDNKILLHKALKILEDLIQ